MNGLKGKTAIVTGGANGIGKAFVTCPAQESTNAIIADNADGSTVPQEAEAKGGLT